jgi:curved DNA-binding protein CbpA
MEWKEFKDPCGFYNILGVTPWSTAGQITKEYHHVALQHHPDSLVLAKEEAAIDNKGEVMRKINEAYRVLGDAQLKAKYDRYRGLSLDIAWEEWLMEWSGHATHWYDPDPQPSILQPPDI